MHWLIACNLILFQQPFPEGPRVTIAESNCPYHTAKAIFLHSSSQHQFQAHWPGSQVSQHIAPILTFSSNFPVSQVSCITGRLFTHLSHQGSLLSSWVPPFFVSFSFLILLFLDPLDSHVLFILQKTFGINLPPNMTHLKACICIIPTTGDLWPGGKLR